MIDPTADPAIAERASTAPGAAPRVPATGAVIRALIDVTLARLARGKAPWIGAVIAALPVAFAAVMHTRGIEPLVGPTFVILRVIAALLAAMFVASSIGDEIEQRTSTYLWSRPIARWTVLAGKLGALAPIATGLVVASWIAAIAMWTRDVPSARSIAALAEGGAAACLAAAGIAALVPRHALALAIGYLLLDNFLSALPFSLRELTIGYQISALGGFTGDAAVAGPAIALAAIGAVWAAIGALRIRRAEA
jgi:hypothetical protein